MMSYRIKLQKIIFSHCLLFLTYCLQSLPANAQADRQKIAIFTPLYLDSAFDATGKFKYEKTGAKMSTPGLDFYYGVQLALDSLKKRNASLDVYIYDTKARPGINQQLAKTEIEDVDLIIAQSNSDETRTLALAAQQKKVPFVSATLPNDAGIFNNPYYVVLNSTLQSHIEAIYHFLQKYHSLDRIVVFTKDGTQEERIKNYFDEFVKTTVTAKLPIRFVDIGNNFNSQTLAAQLDSSKRTICIAGSMDESFANRLVQSLAGLNKNYPIRLFGMPTWENLNFSKINDLEIIYTTPFFYDKNTAIESHLTKTYTATMSSKPSDFFYRGYETTLRFALLLLDTKKDIASNLSRKGNTVLTQFDIQPVFKDKSTMTLDYFENKHLYFIKAFGGVKNILQ
jgi:ABC-type branched-subunit amino acid transport system substrate-binding protein